VLSDGLLQLFERDGQPLGVHHQAFDFVFEDLLALGLVPGRAAATTVPTPAIAVRRPSACRAAMAFWTVFGLMPSSALSWRTEGNGSPARSWRRRIAFLTL